MKRIISPKKFFLIGLMVLFTSLTFGQSNSILQQSSITQSSLNSVQSVKFQKFSTSQFYKNSSIIQVGNLANLATDGRVSLSLPLLPCQNLIFTASKVEYTSENDYYWYGTFDNEDSTNTSCNYGTITLMAKQGRKFGTVNFDGISLEYQDLSTGFQVLSQVKTEMFDENECGVNSLTTVGTEVSPNIILPCVAANNGARILVLWTQAAQNAEANINDRVALAIAQTNQAYSNSQTGNLNIVLAGSQLFAGFTETTDIQGDVAIFSNRADVQALRAATQADIVVLLTNGTYGTTFGIVRDIGPSFNGAYSIVQTNAATGGRFTFAHEVGHLFGARHNTDPTGTIQHGYQFWTRKWFLGKKTTRYTLLATLPAGQSRELHYSNPNVEIQRKSTGTACCNDNAQMHRNIFPTVAAFFPDPLPPFNIDIDLSGGDPNCFPNQVEAVVQCGTAPYTYGWEFSFNGISFNPVGTNSEFLFMGGGCPSTPMLLFFRLTVTDANGLVRTVTRVRPVGFQTYKPSTAASTQQVALTTPKIIEEVYPNPASSNSRVLINLPESGNVKVVLTDFYGNTKKVIHNGKLQKGRNLLYFSTPELISGAYSIQLFYNNKVETKQLIISK